MQHKVTGKVMEWRHTDSSESVAAGEGYGETEERIQQNYVSTNLYCSENNDWRKGGLIHSGNLRHQEGRILILERRMNERHAA